MSLKKRDRIVKESIGRGVFADDPTKRKDDIVFRENYLVMLYQGEVTTNHESAIRYGAHTTSFSLQALKHVFNSQTNRHDCRNYSFKCQKVTHTNECIYKFLAKR